MNPIDALFADLKARRRKAFIPFLTAGAPVLRAQIQLQNPSLDVLSSFFLSNFHPRIFAGAFDPGLL